MNTERKEAIISEFFDTLWMKQPRKLEPTIPIVAGRWNAAPFGDVFEKLIGLHEVRKN